MYLGTANSNGSYRRSVYAIRSDFGHTRRKTIFYRITPRGFWVFTTRVYIPHMDDRNALIDYISFLTCQCKSADNSFLHLPSAGPANRTEILLLVAYFHFRNFYRVFLLEDFRHMRILKPRIEIDILV